MDLVVVLSMAACTPQAMTPAVAPDFVAAPPKAKPVLRVAPAPQAVEPVVEPKPEPVVIEAPALEPELAHEGEDRVKSPMPRLRPVPEKAAPRPKCNPMSRAGCRWNDEVDERDQVRVRVKDMRKAGDAR
jgi:hypothetical protein